MFKYILITLPILSYANPVIVSGEKLKKNINQVTGNTTVLNSEDLSSIETNDLEEVLSSENGIYITSTGPFGGNASLKMRGTKNGFSKIIIDDLELEDVSSISGGFQINQIQTSGIENIEILRGTQSIIYGSDSISGVVKLKSSSKPGSYLNFGYGSHNTQKLAAGSISKKDKLTTKFFIQHLSSDGISSYNEFLTTNAEKDKYSNLNFRSNLSYAFREGSSISLQSYIINSDTDIDNFGSDLENQDQSSYEQQTHLMAYKSRFAGDRLNSKFSYKKSNINRNVQGSSPENNEGKENQLHWTGTFYYSEPVILLFGAEYNQQQSSSSSLAETTLEEFSIYNMTNFKTKRSLTELGFRVLKINNSDDKAVFKLGSSYQIFPNQTLKANIATGYKSPTLYQRSFKSTSSEKLEATESTSGEVSHVLNHRVFSLTNTFFINKLKNEIDWDGAGYKNIAKTQTKGLETSVVIRKKSHVISAQSTIQRARNKFTNVYFSKTPRLLLKNKYQFIVDRDKRITIEHKYIGEREDSGRMPSYSLYNVGVNYNSVTLSLMNIFDKNYENSRSYGTLGRTIRVSYKIKI